nr:craniofacial development protein 2-like [Penaeus vannamei]
MAASLVTVTTQELGPAPVTEQAYSGVLLLTPTGEGPIKGGLNISDHTIPVIGQLHPMTHRICSRERRKHNKTYLKVGTWNVRTLMDARDTDRPERRTALVSRELTRFNIDVAALSETKLLGEGQITEVGSVYTFFWKGKNPKTTAPRFITLISVYAPTLDAEDHVKGAFYQQLDTVISQIPAGDRLLLLGDFNARVGREDELWCNIIGKQGMGNCNDNGLLLLGLCAEQELFITNTQFRLPNQFKTTWKHPRSKHWHILDYAIVRQQHKNEVLITRSMPGANDCWTDHQLLITKLKLTIKRKPRIIQQNEARRRYDTGKLKDPVTSRAFQAAIQQNLPARQLSVDTEWTNIRDAINETARTVIGYQSKQHQDWFDDNDKDIKALINTKQKARIAHDQDPNSQPKMAKHAQAKSQCQARLREIQNCGHTAAGTLLAADNTILMEDYEIQNRWVEHFKTLLNRNSSAQQDFL